MGNDKKELEWVVKTILNNFKNLEVKVAKKLGEGQMSRAYLINNELVFRFPKNKDGATDTEKEINSLTLLKKYISLNIPEFIYIGRQDDGFPFVGYQILTGKFIYYME